MGSAGASEMADVDETEEARLDGGSEATDEERVEGTKERNGGSIAGV